MSTKNFSRESKPKKSEMITTRGSVTPSVEHSLAEILYERNANYGAFEMLGMISQNIKRSFHVENWSELAYDQQECLDLIANKISRILNGNPDLVDSWLDIAGYALLIVNRLRKEITDETSPSGERG
jgi:predicted HAD superfamily Cof-like phosphohydrolase